MQQIFPLVPIFAYHALGIAVADRVLMMENAIYSVISPEGCAAILWRSRDRAEDAADALAVAICHAHSHHLAQFPAHPAAQGNGRNRDGLRPARPIRSLCRKPAK